MMKKASLLCIFRNRQRQPLIYSFASLMSIGLLVLCIMPVVPTSATASSASTESVQRTVLAELFTGTWCQYCQGGEGAMDKLAKEYPRTQLAVIEWHNEDDYVTVDDSGKEREDFYNIGSFPTAYFDGVEKHEGGSTNPDDNSTYDEYKDRIETRLSVSSPIIIRTEGYISGDRAVVDATITAVGSISQSNLSAHFVLYEDHNETVYVSDREYRMRYTALKSLNSSISLSKGDTITRHKEFSLDPAWTKEKLGVVTFVQTNNKEPHGQLYPPSIYYTAEVLQADDLKFITDADVSLTFQTDSGSVAAGGEFVFNGVIKNTGGISESYEFSIQTSLSAWSASYGICKDTSCIPAPYTIDLLPDEEVNVEVTVFSPSSAQAGESAVVTFTVYSETNAHIKSAATLTVNVADELADEFPPSSALNIVGVDGWNIILGWSSTDYDGVGVANVTIYYAINSYRDAYGAYAWTRWQIFTNDTTNATFDTTQFDIQTGDTMYFRSVAVDWNGNEETKWEPDASIIFEPTNRKTILELISNQTAYEGQLFSLQVNATDLDNDTLIFSDNVTLLDINSTTGAISFTPNYNSAGIYFINVTVTDGTDIVWQIFKLTIINVNRAPTAIISSPVNNVKITTDDNILFDATNSYDPNNDTLTYTWTSNIDGNLIIGNAKSFSRKLSAGTHTITLSVSDGIDIDQKQVIVIVESPPAPQGGWKFIPGFDVVIVIIAISGVALALRRKKR